MVTIFKKTLTPTEVKNGFTTPVLILPAPAEGYVRNIFGATEQIVPVSVEYDGVTETSLMNADVEGVPWAYGYIFDLQDADHSRPFSNAVTGGFLYSTEYPIYWGANADSSVGDGVYSVVIVYEDKLIPVS